MLFSVGAAKKFSFLSAWEVRTQSSFQKTGAGSFSVAMANPGAAVLTPHLGTLTRALQVPPGTSGTGGLLGLSHLSPLINWHMDIWNRRFLF